jgi:hypothetical protein
VGQIALAQKPLEVAVGCGANSLAAERWALAAIAHGVRLVALLAVIAINMRPGCPGVQIAG